MKRTLYKALLKWKHSQYRKPLMIQGIRQSGKTWLMKKFGELEYSQCAYINFENNRFLRDIFKQDFEINRIIQSFEIQTDLKILASNTLIILDEIQEAEGAITSLKYFHENAPQYHIISAGSLLGITLHRNASFPVGKVEFLTLYPLSFLEYLDAVEESKLKNLILETNWQIITQFKEKFIGLLRQYYYVGGMPEPVLHFSQHTDFAEVRKIQQGILSSYEKDFSKYAPPEIVPRIRMLWNSIPAQMAKENRKFRYGLIKEGARAKEFELALSWLEDAGFIEKVYNVTKPNLPLKAYQDRRAFKLFFADVGLLCAVCDLDVKILLEGNRILQEFKGVITEQYVLQQILSELQIKPFYWSSEKSTAEIDFIIQTGNHVVPIEVKSEENLQAKSLKIYASKFKPALVIRTSMSDFRTEENLTNIPLYAICAIPFLDA